MLTPSGLLVQQVVPTPDHVTIVAMARPRPTAPPAAGRQAGSTAATNAAFAPNDEVWVVKIGSPMST